MLIPHHSPPSAFLSTGMINPTTDIGKMFQCFTGLCGLISISIPVAVIGGELDRAYTKQFKILKRASDAKRRKLVVEAAKAAKAKAVAAPVVTIGDTTGKPKSQRVILTAMKRQLRNYFTGMRFKHLAARFLRGEMRPFPYSSRLFIAQSIMAAEKAVEKAEVARHKAIELRQRYQESVAKQGGLKKTAKTSAAYKSKPRVQVTVVMSLALAVLGVAPEDVLSPVGATNAAPAFSADSPFSDAAVASTDATTASASASAAAAAAAAAVVSGPPHGHDQTHGEEKETCANRLR